MTTASKTWPSQLPQIPLADGYSEGYEDNVIRSSPDKGASKTRPRFTRLRKIKNVAFILTDSQKTLFDSFYESINGGASQFNFPDPAGGQPIVVMIREAITGPTRVAPNAWRINFSVEVLP